MQLDFFTAFIMTAIIIGTIGLSTLLFSLLTKENRPFIWAAIAGFLFSAAFFLGGFRSVIPDYLSIIVFNLLCVLAMISYSELFCRLLSFYPKRRYLLLILPVVLLIANFWHTYQEPSFRARAITFDVTILVVCFYTIRVLIIGSNPRQLLIHVLAASAFILMGSIGFIRILYLLFWDGSAGTSFTGQTNLLANIAYLDSTVLATASAILLISDRLHYQIKQNARLDPLTSILNRRVLQEVCEREMSLARRGGVPLSLVICDIDHFKVVNDSHGHLTGDAVLVHFVGILQRCLRNTDLLIRYGGEEFVFMLPQTDRANAMITADRIRKTVKNSPYTEGDMVVFLTGSFGVTGFDPESDTLDDMLHRADRAMYDAKDQGRDRVCSRP